MCRSMCWCIRNTSTEFDIHIERLSIKREMPKNVTPNVKRKENSLERKSVLDIRS